ncbi:MAG: hypothetical protein GC206_04025 [Alphaproteobacteria bacterium]|nr:hypothetical protein [Alphaproteobacteria bacterium]
MFRWVTSISDAAHRADFWSRLCFIGLSAIVAACSAYGFFTAYDVWGGFTVASAGGVALAALCAISQFCSLNLSHQARRREGRDRALCLILMIVCGGWSAYGLHHFWDVTQAAAATAEGRVYVPVRSLEDVDGPAALMMAICVAIAFVEPLTFWVLGGTSAAPVAVGRAERGKVERLDQSRGRPRSAALAVAAAAAMATGALPAPVSDARSAPVSDAATRAVRDISAEDVVRAADCLAAAGERVSFRRLAAAMGVSKSKVERTLDKAGVSITEHWPPSRAAA